MSLTTPVYDLQFFPSVYEPSEDTFLFLDALEQDLEFVKLQKPLFIGEVGCGSGIVITSLALVLSNTCTYFAIDINPMACSAAAHTANLNNVKIEIANMDLLSSFRNSLFDILLFNPPYVVTEPEEIVGNGLHRAWAGGENGREIIDLFLPRLPYLLNENGACYMIAIKENKPDEIESTVNNLGFDFCIVKERKIRGEHLFVLRFCKRTL